MSGGFEGLDSSALRTLADALEAGRLGPPYAPISIQRFIAPQIVDCASRDLVSLSEKGFGTGQISQTLRLLAAERGSAVRAIERVEFVWSGPELPGASSRDTAVVVRELFESAHRLVLVSGYAVYQGKRMFKPLAEKMDASPNLRVRLFFNIHRDRQDERADSEITREFAERFKNEQWPGDRVPELFYDPRALSREQGPRACLHAKCVVVDEEIAFVTSANFTEAAHERNIEAGVLLRSASFAQALSGQFEALVQHGALKRLAGLGAG